MDYLPRPLPGAHGVGDPEGKTLGKGWCQILATTSFKRGEQLVGEDGL